MGKHWLAETEPPDRVLDLPAVGLLPAITVQELTAASSRFSVKTAATDGWHPRMFASLSWEARQSLCYLLQGCEKVTNTPRAMQAVIIKLLAKPTGGRRPIALFRSIWRVYMKVRLPHLHAWAAQYVPTAVFNTARGRSVGDTVWRSTVRGLLRPGHWHSLETHMDITKAFDHISFEQLQENATRYDYPPLVLRTALAAYRWERRLVWQHNMAADPLWPQRGVAAGSGFAVYETVLYLMPIAEDIGPRCSEQLQLNIHVDDISLGAAAATPEEVIASMSTEAAKVIATTRQLSLGLDPKKAVLLASSPELAAAARTAFGTSLGQVASKSVRRLGYDYTLNAKAAKRRPVQGRRIQLAKTKFARAQQRYGAKKGRWGHVFTAALQAAIMYGCETVGLKPVIMGSLRAMKLRSRGAYKKGSPVDSLWLRFPAADDPFKQAVWRVLRRYAMEWWYATHPQVAPGDHLTPKELCQLHGLAMRAKPGVDDPAALLQAVTQELGWTWKNPAQLTMLNGEVLTLSNISPAGLKPWVLHRLQTAAAEQFASRGLKGADVLLPAGRGIRPDS